MHQLVHDDLFRILLLRIDRVQQENGLFILAVHLEIAGLAPGRVLHKFQLHVPRRNDPQLFAVFIKNLGQLAFVHRMLLLIFSKPEWLCYTSTTNTPSLSRPRLCLTLPFSKKKAPPRLMGSLDSGLTNSAFPHAIAACFAYSPDSLSSRSKFT